MYCVWICLTVSRRLLESDGTKTSTQPRSTPQLEAVITVAAGSCSDGDRVVMVYYAMLCCALLNLLISSLFFLCSVFQLIRQNRSNPPHTFKSQLTRKTTHNSKPEIKTPNNGGPVLAVVACSTAVPINRKAHSAPVEGSQRAPQCGASRRILAILAALLSILGIEGQCRWGLDRLSLRTSCTPSLVQSPAPTMTTACSPSSQSLFPHVIHLESSHGCANQWECTLVPPVTSDVRVTSLACLYRRTL
ncbi:hypothetical protein F5884DRAFT_274074 [Xylogone sp. PMI_703]|nr:hypothetical protein F5884DRAFT_274074 [Xylogone sp. PMI_703]